VAQVVLLLAALQVSALADDAGSAHMPAPRPLLAVPFTTIPPAGTADPNDPAWKSAATVTGLDLAPGSPVGEPAYGTRIKAMWDFDFLYIRCQVDNDLIPYCIAHGRNVDLTGDDLIVLQIDPQGSGHQWFQVEVSASNDVCDESLSLSGHDLKRSTTSNIEGLQTSTRLTKRGWLADIAIPATPLLAPGDSTQFAPLTTFRANFLRYQYVPAASPADPPRRVVMNWASVASGKEEVSPEGMGFVQLTGGPKPASTTTPP
jgi:hypothetical protein